MAEYVLGAIPPKNKKKKIKKVTGKLLVDSLGLSCHTNFLYKLSECGLV